MLEELVVRRLVGQLHIEVEEHIALVQGHIALGLGHIALGWGILHRSIFH